MDSLRNKDINGSTDFLPVEFLKQFYDNYEVYQIMSEVFYKHIPKEKQLKAMADVADRIKFELKDEYESK